MAFDYELDYVVLDFRQNPELYKIGKGEQGVLQIRPYRYEILPHWQFTNPQVAQESADKIYSMFLEYLDKGEFVGADMARKFLQMGYSRSTRFANHTGNRKLVKGNSKNSTRPFPYSKVSKDKDKGVVPLEDNWNREEKAICAQIFNEKLQLAKQNSTYREMGRVHIEKYGK